MNPTEHELTVANDAIARVLWEDQPAGFRAGLNFDQLAPLDQHRIRERALPFTVAALHAIPDRAAEVLRRVEARACSCNAAAGHLEACPAPVVVRELRA